MPAWLADYRPGAADLSTAVSEFLRSRIAFYPGSGITDGELMETFAASQAAHCILHVDLMSPASLSADALSRKFRPYIHIAGYRAVELEVWDAQATRGNLGLAMQHPYDQDPSLRGACWAVLEREPGLTDAHGPMRFAFLHVQCEAVWLFWNLWVHSRRSGPFGILIQDHGWGGNWTEFGRDGALHQLASQSGHLPNWLLSSPNSAWPGYRRLTDPAPLRSVLLPAALNQGESASVGGRALYARDNFSNEPTELDLIDDLLGTSTCDDQDAAPAIPIPKVTSLALPYSPRRLHFIYGCNMNPIHFHRLCPGSEIVGLAILSDYRWYITDSGVASVTPDPGKRVQGVLARITEEDERQLDCHEGVPLGLCRRQFVPVILANCHQVTALIYTSFSIGVGSPHPVYLEGILCGARHHGLSEEVIAELALWGGDAPLLPEDREPLFVYGPLMRGHSRHGHLASSLFIGEAVTVECYALYVNALPQAFEYDPVSPIHGELYLASPATFATLDQLEGHPDGYRRSRVPVRAKGGATVDAWLYFHLDPSGRIDSGGRWRR